MRSGKLIYYLFTAIIAGVYIPSEAQIKITDGTILTLDPNSLVELSSSNKGLLIPRLAINDINIPAPLSAPVPVGMLVFSSGGTVSDGFYSWNGSQWKKFVQAPITVNDGGTGLSSGTSGGIPAYTGASTLISSGVLTQNALVVGGGTGATPSSIAMGTANQVLAVNSTGTGYNHRAIRQVLGNWGTSNLNNDQNNLQLEIISSQLTTLGASGSRIIMPFNGKIIGITLSGSAPCTAGTATFTVFKNSTATAVTTVINSTGNIQFSYTNTGTVSFVAGDLLDLRVTTNTAFHPENIEYIGLIIIEWIN